MTEDTRYLGPGWINRPKPFDGSTEQAEANFKTHRFQNICGEILCSECECKTWHADALYPCGRGAPREDAYIGPNPSLIDLHPGAGRMMMGVQEEDT